MWFFSFFPGMNAAVRAVVRMGIYVKAKVYFVYEVSFCFINSVFVLWLYVSFCGNLVESE